MSGPVENWQQVAEAFDERYRAIGKTQWEAVTPCTEWNVHGLVAHAVGVQAMFAGALGGTAAPEGDWPAARASMAEAIAKPGALEGMVTHPALGEMPRGVVLGIATTDLLIHTWDLARALGTDDQMPAGPVAAAYEGLQQMPAEVIRASGRFSAALETPADADVQTKMLAFAGRKR